MQIDGVQKGLRTVLTERGKFRDAGGHALRKLCEACEAGVLREQRQAEGFDVDACCATFQEPDFLAQREWLTEVVEGHGCTIIFYPKYHCELNFIELIWGWLKGYHRRTCTYKFADLQRELPASMEARLPVSVVRKAFRHCLRFMAGYRLGLTGPALAYTVRRYRSHRKLTGLVRADIEREYAAYEAKRLK
jgi:hypothetical protein